MLYPKTYNYIFLIPYLLFYSCAADFFDMFFQKKAYNNTLDIVAGSYHTCMLFRGKVRCWGDQDINGYGIPIGLKRLPNSLADNLTFINKDSIVKQITAGKRHTCVLFEDSTVRCWGDNSVGQLGLGNTINITETSRSESDIIFQGVNVLVKQIDAGSDHTCALSTKHQIFCWGSGSNGKLGNNTTFNIGDISPMNPISTVVTKVQNNFPENQNPVKIAAGANHTCIYFENNDITCWGLITELGANGENATRSMAGINLEGSAVSAPESSLVNLSITNIVSGGGVTCIKIKTNRVVCWGVGVAGKLGYGCGSENITTHHVGSSNVSTTIFPSNDDAFRVAYDNQQPITEPLKMDTNDTNCRMDGSIISYQNYTDISQVVIGPGSSYSCVLRLNGTVHCFGANFGVHNLTPSGSINLTAIKTASCTRTAGIDYPGGSPLGYNIPSFENKLTDMNSEEEVETPIISTRNEPIPVGGTAIRIGAGESHVCALLENDQIKCWGTNCTGQLGHGNNIGEATGGGVLGFKKLSSYGTFSFPF